ncbi:MAG TPA: chaperone modulator CbpM [Burkholderiaceae bacterium]
MEIRHTAVLVDEASLTVEEFTLGCNVDHAWLIEHIEAGVLPAQPGSDSSDWRFSGADLRRGRRLLDLERTFDAGPELAGLVVDLLDEVERMKAKLRRAGISTD